MKGGITVRHSCPNCNTVTELQNALLNVWVCSCGKILRNNNGILEYESCAAIKEKADILQPGTTGNYNGQSFLLTGRIRIYCNEETINYWTVVLDDGDIGLLEESYGFYSFFIEDKTVTQYSEKSLKNVGVNNTLSLKPKQPFILTCENNPWKIEIEGSVNLSIMDKPVFLDFASDNGSKISVIKWNADKIIAYTVQDFSFEAFQFNKLRNNNNTSFFSVRCNKCNENIQVQTFPYAASVACKNCGAGYQHYPNIGFVNTFQKKKDPVFNLKLGSKGIIDNISWEIIGYTQKEENNSYHANWKEYTLYSQMHGYSFLSEYAGHWIFLKEQAETPVLLDKTTRSFEFKKTEYKLFNAYYYKILYAAGEFPYNIFNNNDTEAKEFIAPPFIWIREKNNEEGIRWFWGRHISKKEIAASFKPEKNLPYKKGIGAVQPIGFKKPERLMLATLIAFLILLFTHIIFANTLQNKLVFEGNLLFNDSTNQASYVSSGFELKKYRGNMLFSISAPVNNNWVEVNATLVDVKTGKEYSVSQGIEYYFGYTDGESWSEGTRVEEAYLTNIPAGTYQLQLLANRDSAAKDINLVQVSAEYDVESTRNIIIPTIIILVWALGSFYIGQVLEKERWRYSQYSPYTYSN